MLGRMLIINGDLWTSIIIIYYVWLCVLEEAIVVQYVHTDWQTWRSYLIEMKINPNYEIKINSNKSKALSFTRARVKGPQNYSLGNQKIPEASCCKYLEFIIRTDLSWADR
jgi:hypothetical protein